MTTTRAFWTVISAVALVSSGVTAQPAKADQPLAFQAGIAVQVAPTYEGSGDYKILAVPVVFPAGSDDPDDRVQFRGLDHLQFALINANGFQFGPLVGYRFGRDQDDGRLLHGLGDIDGGIVGGAFVSYRLGAIRASMSYHHQLSGDDTGGVVKFGLDTRHKLSPTLELTAAVGATWADDDYMQSFFGVTAAQAVTSGHALYLAEAGIKDVNLNIGSELQLSPQWMLRVNGRYARLVGDASDSPVVESRDQWSGGFSLTYQFSTRP